MTNHKKLLRLSASMPMKQIDIEGKPYLQRYYAGESGDGKCDLWLHRFLSSDGDRHVHNHPFEAYSIVLNGGYDEQRHGMKHISRTESLISCSVIDALINRREKIHQMSFIGAQQPIGPMTWHRIEKVEPDTWTLMIVRKDQQRLPFWYFMENGKFTSVPSSPVEWWKGCGVRKIETAGQLIEEFQDLSTDDAINIFNENGVAGALFYHEFIGKL